MVYSNKHVMCILIDGQVQKELANGEVHIPFGSEYVIRFRNKHDRKSVVKFWIDGELASGEGGFVIPANDHIDIKRYATKDVAFKFVDLESPEAVDAGKNGPNPDKVKGLIEAHFFLEKKKDVIKEIHHNHYHPYPYPVYPNPNPWKPYREYWMDNTSGRTPRSISSSSNSQEAVFCSSTSVDSIEVPIKSANIEKLLKEGCTVEGSSTGQTFTEIHLDLETDYTVLKIFLKGYQASEKVMVQTSDKYCANCGTKSKKSANFCSTCGTKV